MSPKAAADEAEELLEGGFEGVKPLYAWIAETLRAVWPRLVQMGIVAGTGPAETLEASIRSRS
jgi:hypothetical protein